MCASLLSISYLLRTYVYLSIHPYGLKDGWIDIFLWTDRYFLRTYVLCLFLLFPSVFSSYALRPPYHFIRCPGHVRGSHQSPMHMSHHHMHMSHHPMHMSHHPHQSPPLASSSSLNKLSSSSSSSRSRASSPPISSLR